jgi:fermentation-respiration switch protein FrsA (DUF1100 family)
MGTLSESSRPKHSLQGRQGQQLSCFMPVVRMALGLALAYVVLALLAWLFQDRLAFPAPRGAVPDPEALGVRNGERVELTLAGGTKLAGWFLRASGVESGTAGPGLLWFYGNGENIARIWPILREFQPPGVALLVVDYPGYGGSQGRASEPAIYEAAEAAFAALAARPEVSRVYVYGRSLGSAVAVHTAASQPAAGLILESPFTSAAAMARLHYGLVPRVLLRLKLDSAATIRRVNCPVLIFHGTEDRLVPISMGESLAAAAPGPVEFVTIPGASHNSTYDVGAAAYRDRLTQFVTRLR